MDRDARRIHRRLAARPVVELRGVGDEGPLAGAPAARAIAAVIDEQHRALAIHLGHVRRVGGDLFGVAAEIDDEGRALDGGKREHARDERAVARRQHHLAQPPARRRRGRTERRARIEEQALLHEPDDARDAGVAQHQRDEQRLQRPEISAAGPSCP